MAPSPTSSASERRCPVSGKAGVCPMMAKTPNAPCAAAPEKELRTHLEAGSRHAALGEHVKALKAFTLALDLEPTSEEASCGKVAALVQLKRPRGALKACRLGLGASPSCQRLLDAAAQLAAELGEEADRIFAEVTKEEEAEVPTDDSGAVSPASSGTGSGGEDVDAAGACPASRSLAAAKRDAAVLRSGARRSAVLEAELSRMDVAESLPFRRALKDEFVEFYRDFYSRNSTKNVDTTQYTKVEKKGLVIKEGHRHIPRPDKVDVPEDWKHPVGTLTPEQLAGYSSAQQRMLICVHGDLFDVSDRPDKYGPEGPYSSMAGHDITWALWSGYDDEVEWDRYHDVYQATPREERDRRLQGLMSWWAFYEQEYGSPVGRLSAYEREWALPPPPAVRDLCVVM